MSQSATLASSVSEDFASLVSTVFWMATAAEESQMGGPAIYMKGMIVHYSNFKDIRKLYNWIFLQYQHKIVIQNIVVYVLYFHKPWLIWPNAIFYWHHNSYVKSQCFQVLQIYGICMMMKISFETKMKFLEFFENLKRWRNGKKFRSSWSSKGWHDESNRTL